MTYDDAPYDFEPVEFEFYVHELFDHPATPSEGCAPHDHGVDQYDCLGCHDRAHAQYAQDIAEVTDGSVQRDFGTPMIYADDTDHVGRRANHGPTAFLLIWHERNGYPCLTTGT